MSATIWYYETVSALGRWSPCTSPLRPETVRMGGHLRLRKSESVGPRIRAIVEVPAHLANLTLDELQAALSPDAGAAAISTGQTAPGTVEAPHAAE